jgi:hypothetical protein
MTNDKEQLRAELLAAYLEWKGRIWIGAEWVTVRGVGSAWPQDIGAQGLLELFDDLIEQAALPECPNCDIIAMYRESLDRQMNKFRKATGFFGEISNVVSGSARMKLSTVTGIAVLCASPEISPTRKQMSRSGSA